MSATLALEAEGNVMRTRIVIAALVLASCEMPEATAPEAQPAEPPVPGIRAWLPPISPPQKRGGTGGIPDNAELSAIRDDDERDHRSIPSGDELDRRDAARLARTLVILESDGARSASDYYAVAVVFEHGTTLDDLASARRYAVVAAKLGERRGVRLAAEAWDRWLVRAGFPQHFGTLARCDDDGCSLHPYEPTTTDDERARWDLPPLRELKWAADRTRRLR
jgi:hypothetical protein